MDKACFTSLPYMFSLFATITMIKRLSSILLLCLLAVLVWFLWQKPALAPAQKPVRIAVPEQAGLDGEINKKVKLWRVVTRRLVTRTAANSLSHRLKQMGLAPIELSRLEKVTLYAFDDAVLYKTQKEASIAAELWRAKGIDVDIIKVNDALYMLGLGRLYQRKYAEMLQQELDKTGKLYRYQRRRVAIPTWRFTFPAGKRASAQALWKQLEETGVMMPVLMPE